MTASIEANVPEKQIHSMIVRTLRMMGCAVYNLSQARASKQTEGLPDLYVFPPREMAPPFWIEVKRNGGVQSLAQQAFQDRCWQNGVPYILGAMGEVLEHLKSIGMIWEGQAIGWAPVRVRKEKPKGVTT